MFFSVTMDLTEEGEGMGSLRPGNETVVMQAVSLWAVSDLGTRLWLCNQFQLMGSLRPGNETVVMQAVSAYGQSQTWERDCGYASSFSLWAVSDLGPRQDKPWFKARAERRLIQRVHVVVCPITLHRPC